MYFPFQDGLIIKPLASVFEGRERAFEVRVTDPPGVLISQLERGLVLLLRRRSVYWCCRRIRVRVRLKLIGDDLLLGSGIRVERAVLKNMMLWTEMGVDVGGEARHGVLLSLDLLELFHQMLLQWWAE